MPERESPSQVPFRESKENKPPSVVYSVGGDQPGIELVKRMDEHTQRPTKPDQTQPPKPKLEKLIDKPGTNPNPS